MTALGLLSTGDLDFLARALTPSSRLKQAIVYAFLEILSLELQSVSAGVYTGGRGCSGAQSRRLPHSTGLQASSLAEGASGGLDDAVT